MHDDSTTLELRLKSGRTLLIVLSEDATNSLDVILQRRNKIDFDNTILLCAELWLEGFCGRSAPRLLIGSVSPLSRTVPLA